MHPSLGRHLTLDAVGCDSGALRDPARVEAAMRAMAEAAQATVVACHLHPYAPQGVSGVLIIAESHITIHTWPEHGFAAADVFTCGGPLPSRAVADALGAVFAASRVVITGDFERGTETLHQEPGPDWQEQLSDGRAAELHAAIDLHGCTRGAPVLGSLVTPFQGRSQARGSLLHWEHASLWTRFDLPTIRLDAASERWFDARALAEDALAHFGGTHYHLHLVLRR